MAEIRWLGAAVDEPDVYEITVGGTWAESDFPVFTINGKEVKVRIGTTVTTASIATAMLEAVNGTAQSVTDNVAETTGDKIGEFADITATISVNSASVILLTGDTLGKPFTLTATDNSTSGTFTIVHDDGAANESSVATSRHHWDNVDNWEGGSVPVDDSDVIFDSGDVDLLYALDASIQPDSIKVLPGYTGNIGLPKTNRDNPQFTYAEYLEDYLTLDVGTGVTVVTIEGGGGRIKIDADNCAGVTYNINSTAQRIDDGVPAILIKDDGSSTTNVVNIIRGDVGIAFYNGEAMQTETLNVSYFENIDTDAKVICGDGVVLTNSAIVQLGGKVTIDSTTSSGTIKLLGGELTILSAAHADIEVDGGTLFYQSSGTITIIEVGSGGILDFRRDLNARTVTAINIYSGATVHDPKRSVTTWSAGIDLIRCSLDEVTLDIGTHLRLTPGAVA